MRFLTAIFALSLIAPAAAAGDLTVQVRDQSGRPVADAVVAVRRAAGYGGAAARFTAPPVMNQQDIAFTPYVLIVPVGSTVAFPNRDKVRHHVYSFSAARRFELKLYGREEKRSVTFDQPGVVALGCNIHDQMIGYVYVTDSPLTVLTGADGVAVVPDVPAGAASLSVWHPNLRARSPVARPFTVAAQAQSQAVAIDLRPTPSR